MLSVVTKSGVPQDLTCGAFQTSAAMVVLVFVVPLQIAGHPLELGQKRLQAANPVVRLQHDEELTATGVVTSCNSVEVDVDGVVLIDATGGLVPRACRKKPDADPSVVATNGVPVVVTDGVTSHGGIE